MAQICSNYYKKLYTARESPEASVGAQEAALSYLSDKLISNAKAVLQALISQEELQTTLWDMRSGKSPGLMAFY